MGRALSIYVVPKRLDWQRQQSWTFFGEHNGDLPFGRTMNARVGPARLPPIKVILRLLETLETESFQRCLFRMSDAAFDFSFPIRMPHPARQRHGAVMPEHVAVKGIECGVV